MIDEEFGKSFGIGVMKLVGPTTFYWEGPGV